MATCGIAAGAQKVYETLRKEITRYGLNNVIVAPTGCNGLCHYEPIVDIYVPGKEKVTYVQVTAEKIKKIIALHLFAGKPVLDYAYEKDMTYQMPIALSNSGIINPESIEEYIALGGYRAEIKALDMKPEEVIAEIKASGLRGRGGGGFLTGLKWEYTARAEADQKYVLCNADEGDPGAFMDRSILEGDPHKIIEAMSIAGYAIEATCGFIYVRAEYPLAVKRLELAIEQARKLGLLGKNILGKNFSFDLEIRLGAGAFVCGEETALMASIEGKRGEPRPRPPFPALKGLFNKPTLLNNVETFANVPMILNNGAEWYSSIGTAKSKGTKVFALGGKINNTGLIEIPMGTRLGDVIYKIGGGIPKGKKFKAAQTGGPSGGCIPADYIDSPIEYETLIELGSMMGSGGLIVMDEETCMVDVARFFLEFTVEESCGKCPPCRIGTKRMLELLAKITNNEGQVGDLEKLEQLAKTITAASLCGLGQTAPNPVLSTIRYFRSEYEAHIIERKCPAGVCKAFLEFTIIDDKCRKCGLCARTCPVRAITGKIKEQHVIDREKCTKCGLCMSKCPVKAIQKKSRE
ncbi:NADH-quinone oxidoreductase subunit NuoF [Heliorestis acidaminivorans]|nr:NADH-quinone oxidoreductase subunit NuoF [Heliorestis acidaminivorans]